MTIPQDEFETLRARARAAAERIALPFRQGLRGTSGHIGGSGTGSSIDFQDHRPYTPGDDPRHIDWQAYARSGHYTMKLYREEVRPLADIAFDLSASMAVSRDKSLRALETALFCRESALRHGAAVRLFTLKGGEVNVCEAEERWPDFGGGAGAAPDWSRLPWRAGSLRVIVSDLLYPALPGALISPLLANRGRALILSPYCPEESDPGWQGNWELEDCETGSRQELRFHQEDLRAYETAYEAHFELWRAEAMRLGVPFARIRSGGDLVEALTEEGLARAAVVIK